MAPTSPADYPTLGFDPSPGDIEECEGLSNTLKNSYDAMNEIANVLHGADDGEWRGLAAVAFRDLLDRDAKRKIDDATSAFEKSYRAMESWARSVDIYQSRSAGYERLAAQAAEDLAAAQSSLGGLGDPQPPNQEPPQDPQEREQQEQDDRDRDRFGEAAREAQERLDRHIANAREMLDDDYTPEGNRLAAQLEDAIGIAPPEPDWFSSALDALGDVVDQIGDVLADIVDITLQILEELAPILEVIGEVAGFLSAVLGVLSIAFPVLAPFALGLAVLALGANYLAAAGESGSFLQPLTSADFWLDVANVAVNALGVGLYVQGLKLATPTFAGLFRGATLTSQQGMNFLGSYKIWQLGVGFSAGTGSFAIPDTVDMVTGQTPPTQTPSAVG